MTTWFADGPSCANVSRETRRQGRKTGYCHLCRKRSQQRALRRCSVNPHERCVGICRICYDRDGSVVHLTGPFR